MAVVGFFTPSLLTTPGPVEGGTVLSGQRYRVRLAPEAQTPGWSFLGRPDGAWYFSLFTAAGVPLVRRVLLRVTNEAERENLLASFAGLEGMPPGRFRVLRPAGGDARPTLSELGTAVLLEYVDPSDEDAAAAEGLG